MNLSSLVSSNLLPAGAVMPFANNSVPAGWLAANGAQLLKTSYSALFAAIGITYGETNGSGGVGTTHFRVPDLRGYFVRGAGTNSDATGSGTFGAKQAGSVGDHSHGYNYALATYLTITGENSWPGVRPNHTLVNAVYPLSGGTASTANRAGDGVGTEARPANIAMLYCIKF